MDPREQRLEHARAALEDVDEIDPPGPRRILAALHLHERRDRVRGIREEQIVVRRDEIEDDRGHDDQAEKRARHPERRELPTH